MALKSTEVCLNTESIGVLSLHKVNKLRFEYDAGYAGIARAIPFSFSMPLTQRIHNDSAVRNFCWVLFRITDGHAEQGRVRVEGAGQ